MRLSDALSALDEVSLAALCRRRGVTVDPAKRLSAVEQVARALATPVELSSLERLPDEVQQVVRVLQAAPKGLPREALGGAVLRLIDAGLASVMPGAPDRIAIPSEYRVQLPPSPSEHPRSARLLLSSADDQTLHGIAVHYLGRMPAAPRAIVLGDLLEVLESRDRIEAEIDALPPRERQLLSAIEARGGELESAELLDLEREPARYAKSVGAVLPRRSAAHALTRRGYLFVVGPDAWAVPAEVAEVVGRERRATLQRARARAMRRIAALDRTPARADLALDPGPFAVAMLCGLRAEAVALSSGGGAPRSALRRIASSVGADADGAEMLVALARASGLAASSSLLGEVGSCLFAAWLRGGAWDEARLEPDRLRTPDRVGRLASPTGPLRGALLDALEAVPPSAFARADDVERAALADLRTASAERLLARAGERAPDAFVAEFAEVVRRLLRTSLPVLGAVDRGHEDGELVVRLSARARRWLDDDEDGTGVRMRRTIVGSPPPAAAWRGSGRLLVDRGARVASVISLADAVTAFVADDALWLELGAETIDRAVRRGIDLGTLRGRVVTLAGDLDEASARLFAAAEQSRVRCELVAASGFLAIEDARLREALLSDPAAAEIFVEPSPIGGLLIRAGVSQVRLIRLLRRHGAEIANNRSEIS